MTTRSMIDSAYPLHPEPVKDITLVYIGGDTPHSWTAAEIRALPSRWVLPTWVRSDPQDVQAVIDAEACIARLAELGVPQGTTVCLDLETAVAPLYVNTFNRILGGAGFRVGQADNGWLTLKYGSTDFIWRNPKTSGGTYIADPGEPVIPAIGDCVARQYAYDGGYDLSVVKDAVPLWEINPVRPPVPWEVTMIKSLPLLKAGATGDPVLRAQALVVAAGVALTLDGIYGPKTVNAVRVVQADHGIGVDGMVGEHTWAVLVTGSDL